MIVKVCGVRTGEVAETAVAAGADWVGIVLEPRSVRSASDAEARAVARAVHNRADLVGVMVDATPAECDEAASRYHLAAVQVHGRVDAAAALACSVPVIRALTVRDAPSAFRDEWWPACALLLDSAPLLPGGLPGGTGRGVDRDVATALARHRRVVLAGGLHAGNVAAAIEQVGPWGVDASSALESRPGVKDPALVDAYVRAARGAAA